MSLKSDIASGKPKLLASAVLRLLEKIEHIERELAATRRGGSVIGETEHGDRVYAVATQRAASPMAEALRRAKDEHAIDRQYDHRS